METQETAGLDKAPAGSVAEIRALGKQRMGMIHEQWDALVAEGKEKNLNLVLRIFDWVVVAGVVYFAAPQDYLLAAAPALVGFPLWRAFNAATKVADVLPLHLYRKSKFKKLAKKVRSETNQALRMVASDEAANVVTLNEAPEVEIKDNIPLAA